MISNYVSGHIQRDFNEMFEWMLSSTRPNGTSRSYNHKYLDMIVYITLQFIMAQAV